MIQYLVRRALHSVVVLAGLVVLLFFFTHVLGDTVYLMLPPESPEEAFEDLREALGLNRPLYVQFFSYIGGVLQGDFGDSIVYREVPAMDLVLERLPKSAYLGAVAWAIALIGVPLGVLAAKWPRSLYDRAINVLSFASVSLPGFWLALMLILVVSVQWQLTPTSGFGGYTGFKYMVLPVIALVPSVIGSLALITRAAMTEEMGKPYATVARAKGLGEQAVAQGKPYMVTAWWAVVVPGMAIFLTVLCANLFGVWLRAVNDPLQRWQYLRVPKEAEGSGGWTVGTFPQPLPLCPFS